MKKPKFLLAAFGLLALSACSDNDGGMNVPVDGSDGNNYIKIRIASAQTSGTRADGFVSGTEDEKNIKNLRFYFFDDNGNPVSVTVDGLNWVEHAPTNPQDNADSNIDKTFSAIAILKIAKDTKKPTKMVTIANPESITNNGKGLDGNSHSLSELAKITDNLSGTNNGFIMSTSVYKTGSDGSSAHINYTTLTDDNYYSTESEAQSGDKFVKVYLDRALAKVQLSLKLEQPSGANTASPTVEAQDKSGTGYWIGDYDIYDGTIVTSKPIYAVFLGWNLTQTAKKSYLVKNHDNNWLTSDPFANWNDASNFRSYWAKNPEGLEFNYTNFSNDSSASNQDTQNGVANPLDGNTVVYVQENAPGTADDKVSKPTQVFVGVKFIDEDGKNIEIAELANQKMLAANLRTAYLSMYCTNGRKLYRREKGDIGNQTISAVDESCINILTATELNDSSSDAYYVYAQVDETKYDYSWDQTNWANISDINTELKNIGHAKIWNFGYYFFDIIHQAATLSSENDIPGVIRNHFYKCEITAVKGLGTPVYKPGEVIIPERPEFDDFVISAEINVLSWKENNHGYELE